MAKKTPAHATDPTDDAAQRVLPPSMIVPYSGQSVVLEFFLAGADPQLHVDTHAVVAWQISDTVEPITVAPPRIDSLRCLVESLGSVMSYTFLDDTHARFDTLTAATAHARTELEP
jgi:hypothetical protein